MKLFVSNIFSIEIENNKSLIVFDLSDDLGKYFKKLFYGNDLLELGINLICVSSRFEPFFIPKKPKYVKEKKELISNHTKKKHTIEKCLEYDVKLDFETFKNGTEEESRKLLAKEIMNSLSVLDDMKKKIKDFDSEKFKADLESYFKKNGLL